MTFFVEIRHYDANNGTVPVYIGTALMITDKKEQCWNINKPLLSMSTMSYIDKKNNEMESEKLNIKLKNFKCVNN